MAFFFEWIRDIFSRSKWIRVTKKVGNPWLKHNRVLLNVKKSNAMIFKWKYQRKIDLLNTNIDAIEDIIIKCENEKIPFVKKFTLGL